MLKKSKNPKHKIVIVFRILLQKGSGCPLMPKNSLDRKRSNIQRIWMTNFSKRSKIKEAADARLKYKRMPAYAEKFFGSKAIQHPENLDDEFFQVLINQRIRNTKLSLCFGFFCKKAADARLKYKRMPAYAE